eukprot:TRINITY_DN8846_c0_g1_i3.p1 TRINITY_DN8846_c0_g1~~TRINITY_DN8846_c0_g1_i3.p1  ORF type:complete len:303 (+),score=22.14 TRINITY_DN8846_c0_g1_i3:85-993(+)
MEIAQDAAIIATPRQPSTSHLPKLCLACAFGSVGTAVRYGLGKIANESTFAALPSAMALVLGCFVMGIMAQTSGRLPPWLSYAITTGFCGACTTFSSWQASAATVAIDDADTLSSTTQGYGWLCILLLGGLVSSGAHSAGKAFAKVISQEEQESGPSEHKHLSLAAALSLSVLIIGALLLAGFLTDDEVFLYATCLFAPLGVLLRALLGLRYNSHHRPLGTLLANSLGCLFLAVVLVIQRRHDHATLQGAAVGFAGSLTTVSSWIKEVHSLSPRPAVYYAILSIGIAQVFFISINGVDAWLY